MSFTPPDLAESHYRVNGRTILARFVDQRHPEINIEDNDYVTGAELYGILRLVRETCSGMLVAYYEQDIPAITVEDMVAITVKLRGAVAYDLRFRTSVEEFIYFEDELCAGKSREEEKIDWKEHGF